MIKIPLMQPGFDEPLPSEFIGCCWSVGTQYVTKYFLAPNPPDGFGFKRNKDGDEGWLTHDGLTPEDAVRNAQTCDPPAVCFAFSSLREREEWYAGSDNKLCPLCAQTPCACQNEP